jgi:hypothetical protein
MEGKRGRGKLVTCWESDGKGGPHPTNVGWERPDEKCYALKGDRRQIMLLVIKRKNFLAFQVFKC